MKAGDVVYCINNVGVGEWLSVGSRYTVEAVVCFGDAVPGSSDPGCFYGNMEAVQEKGLVLMGVDARYDCGGRMAFQMGRFAQPKEGSSIHEEKKEVEDVF